MAALLHSTDEPHEQVVVLPEHVQAVELYIDQVYRASNFRLDSYAGVEREQSELADGEAAQIDAELAALDREVGGEFARPLGPEVVALYRRNEILTATEIGDLLDADRRTVTKRLRVLKNHDLIAKRQNGHARTAKFNTYLEGKKA